MSHIVNKSHLIIQKARHKQADVHLSRWKPILNNSNLYMHLLTLVHSHINSDQGHSVYNYILTPNYVNNHSISISVKSAKRAAIYHPVN